MSDLGYFNVGVIAEMVTAGEHLLSHLQYGTHVLLTNGEAVDLLPWLGEATRAVCRPIDLAGGSTAFGMSLDRLAIYRGTSQSPTPKAASRHEGEKGQRALRRASGLVRLDDPGDKPTFGNVDAGKKRSFYIGALASGVAIQTLEIPRLDKTELSGSTVTRQMVRVWARMLAVLLQQWIIVGTIWGDQTKSLSKAYEAVRGFAGRMAGAMEKSTELECVLESIAKTVGKTCRRDRALRPGTFELVNDPELLEFRLS